MTVTLRGGGSSESGFRERVGVSSCLFVALRGVDTVDRTGSDVAESVEADIVVSDS